LVGTVVLLGSLYWASRDYVPGVNTASVDEVPYGHPWKWFRFSIDAREAAFLWLPIRLYVGWDWLDAWWHKFTDPAWMYSGEGILSFWQKAVTQPTKFPAYRDFIQYLIDAGAHPWFAKLIVFSEFAVGMGIVLGALVGVAAFFGALMNMSFLLAGTVSTNPVLFFFEIWLILAYKTAGWWGLDRVLLPWLDRVFKTVPRVVRSATPTRGLHNDPPPPDPWGNRR
jgi:thiosulfate dehydrogenase [quinone] large subunit